MSEVSLTFKNRQKIQLLRSCPGTFWVHTKAEWKGEGGMWWNQDGLKKEQSWEPGDLVSSFNLFLTSDQGHLTSLDHSVLKNKWCFTNRFLNSLPNSVILYAGLLTILKLSDLKQQPFYCIFWFCTEIQPGIGWVFSYETEWSKTASFMFVWPR